MAPVHRAGVRGHDREGSEGDSSLTFDPSMSISTKLGFTSSVTLLYAPVADPGLMRNLPSYSTACKKRVALSYLLPLCH